MAITVNGLKEICEEAIKKGYGDREIYISADDEGNDFHELIYGFSVDSDILEDIAIDYDDIIALG